MRFSNRFDKIVQTSLLAAVVSWHRPATGNVQLCCPEEDSHPWVDRPLSQVTSNGKMTGVVSAETRENLQLSVPLRAKWSPAGPSPETRPHPLVPGLHTQLFRPLMLHMPSHEAKTPLWFPRTLQEQNIIYLLSDFLHFQCPGLWGLADPGGAAQCRASLCLEIASYFPASTTSNQPSKSSRPTLSSSRPCILERNSPLTITPGSESD